MPSSITSDNELLHVLLSQSIKLDEEANMQPQYDLTSKDKIDLLKHMELIQRAELNYRRDFEYKIFAWSNSILLLLVGALLVIKPSEQVVVLSYGAIGKLVASAAVLLLVTWSIQWQDKNRKTHVANAHVIRRIDHLLHFFEQGYFDQDHHDPIFPRAWLTYGDEKVNLKTRLSTINYSSATAILGFLTVVMIWVS